MLSNLTETAILHNMLYYRNVLVGDGLYCVIADFGMSIECLLKMTHTTR